MTLFNKSIAVDLGPEIKPKMLTVSKTADKFITDITPVWCPGCSDYEILDIARTGLAYMVEYEGLDPDTVVVISGIGCSGRIYGYINAYGFHTTHGGPIAAAEGVQVANDRLLTVIFSGDGDTGAIGLDRLISAGLRNTNAASNVINNSIYGLTKGQGSPTTLLKRTGTTPYGSTQKPLDFMELGLASKATFIARIYPHNTEEYKLRSLNTFIAALKHRGFALIEWISICSTFNTLDSSVKATKLEEIPSDHDVTDRAATASLAFDQDKTYEGIFYQVQEPTLTEKLDAISKIAQKESGPVSVEQLFAQFR